MKNYIKGKIKRVMIWTLIFLKTNTVAVRKIDT